MSPQSRTLRRQAEIFLEKNQTEMHNPKITVSVDAVQKHSDDALKVRKHQYLSTPPPSCPYRSRSRHLPPGTHCQAISLAMKRGQEKNLRKRNLEALLNGLENRLIVGAADEGDTEALGTEATGTTDTMKIGISLVRHVVVDSDVDALHIDTTAENVSGDADASLELFELLVTLDASIKSASKFRRIEGKNVPLLLSDAGMDSSAGEVALSQKLVEFGASER